MNVPLIFKQQVNYGHNNGGASVVLGHNHTRCVLLHSFLNKQEQTLSVLIVVNSMNFVLGPVGDGEVLYLTN